MSRRFVLGLWFVAACGARETTSVADDPSLITKCVTLQRGSSPVADTFIKSNDLRGNFGARSQLRVSASDETLVRFELSSIPASATITKATLDLFTDGAAGDGTIRIHRVTAPWTETGVTYASFHQAFAPDLVGALKLERKTAQKSVDLTAQVSAWVRGAHPNYGVELDEGPDHHAQRDHDGDDDADPTQFASSESPAHRPALDVCYRMYVDECAAAPCHNGGTCTNHDDGYTCACAPGFTGPTCDTAVDHCAASPCQNGGGCTNTSDGYTCACATGYTGTNCETNINDCASAPCANGGVCTDGIASYTCACQPGYDGANCEHLIDNCSAAPCHNGGVCVSGVNSFTCACPAGFTGTTCDTNIDDCVGNACMNGSCVDGIGSYTCACAPDWGGAHCDVNLNACAQMPCLNGGACADGLGTYTCTCPTGYTGANCEIDIDDCAPNPCANGGVCVDGVASYTCTCPSGFTGAQCQTALPPPVELRIGGTCYAVCQDADPSATGWGWENNASCINPGDPLAASSPFCSTAVPPVAYEAPSAPVTDATTSVATIPRPPHITVAAAHDCPYAASDLVAFDPAWIAADHSIAIPPNVRVLVRGNTDIPADLLVPLLNVPSTSELIFADQAATFRVTDINVDGALRLGSETCRLESAINFVFDTTEDTGDPAVRQVIYNRMGLGLMVGPTGVLEMFGHLYQPTWTRLAATANAGDATLALADAVDWQPGQRIVIATSGRQDYPLDDQNEERGITSVSGQTVTLDAPLAFRHYGGPEYQVEVGLLSHNLALSTAPHLLDVAPFGGHIMVHSKNARISGVSLSGMGQQNFLARYPFHFHLSGDVGNASYFTDSSVIHSNWRCAVIHRTDRSIISRNVAYDNFGHCFYIEDGVEMNNEVSFNLAVKTKIMGPTDAATIASMKAAGQTGFTQVQTPDLAQPADRAAAGFYITNGNNKIIGNASSGGFAGFSLPNLPRAINGSTERIFPILYGASDFDGNTAHSAGYLWAGGPGACIYIGGTLTQDATGQLTYVSGRTTDFTLLRHQTEVFNNTKTFLCESGITHWGSEPRIVNFEAWDNSVIATLFGQASIQSALSFGTTGNTAFAAPPNSFWQRGFQFYDTGTQTILHDVAFHGYHHDAFAATHIPGWITEWDNCALLSMTHSDEYTPQHMNTVAGLHFVDVDDSERLCIGNTGTLSSRNFNVFDTDGSLSGSAASMPAPRLVASAYASSWHLSSACVAHAAWNALICPLVAPQNVAAVAVQPNANVSVTMYGLDNTTYGENHYSGTTFFDAQMTGPSNIGWHHAFPGGVPDSFYVEAIQVPDDSFVLLSFTLPPGVACSVGDAPFTAAPDLPTLLASTTPVFTTAQNTCFVRIPPTHAGSFEASGLSVPNILWVGNPQPGDFFTVTTGCTSANPACASVVSTVPTLP